MANHKAYALGYVMPSLRDFCLGGEPTLVVTTLKVYALLIGRCKANKKPTKSHLSF